MYRDNDHENMSQKKKLLIWAITHFNTCFLSDNWLSSISEGAMTGLRTKRVQRTSEVRTTEVLQYLYESQETMDTVSVGVIFLTENLKKEILLFSRDSFPLFYFLFYENHWMSKLNIAVVAI